MISMTNIIGQICRICLKEEGDLKSIFRDDECSGEDVTLSQKIMACASVQVMCGDGLPELICSKCSVDVDISYGFQSKCQSSDATLRKYLSVMTPIINTIDEESQEKKSVDQTREDSLYLELEPEYKFTDTSLSTGTVYDFDKESFSSTGDKSLQDRLEDSDSDEPLISRQEKCKDQKRLLEKGKDTKSTESLNEETSDSDKRKRLKEESDVECPICKKTFAYMCILKDHMVQHTGARPYLCSTCGKSFAHTTSLTNHMKTHYSDKPHKCERCNLSFHRKAHLVLHMRTHTGEKPYVCDICGREFAQNSYLKEHLRVHSGEKPFICDICGHGFARKSCMVMHRRVHTGELPYACPECGRAFSQRSQRKRHVKRNHKGSACLRDTGELILRDLDFKNRKIQENLESLLSENSLNTSQRDATDTCLLQDTWSISFPRTNSLGISSHIRDVNEHSNTSSIGQSTPLPLTLQIPRSLLQ